MKSQLFIPKKCKAGFNVREDCYSKRLGYVIAWDGKKWRKEPSWESWRQKEGASKGGSWDHNLGKYVTSEEKFGEEVRPIEFDNSPTSGFVLNKKVGGYKSGWDVRQTYSRVYDPRGFEFEINVPNLLYILEHSNCMRGKGLEGEFVYAWDGKDLVLLPVEAPEFKAANNYTKLQALNIKSKEITPGIIYKSKKEEEYVYLGKFPWYGSSYWGRKKGDLRFAENQHIFYPCAYKGYGDPDFVIKKSLDFLAQKVSDDESPEFGPLIDKLASDIRANKIINYRLSPVNIEKAEATNKNSYNHPYEMKRSIYFYKTSEDVVSQVHLTVNVKWSDVSKAYILQGYETSEPCSFNFKTDKFSFFKDEWVYGSGWPGASYRKSNSKFYNEEELKSLNYCDLYVTLENGKEIKIDNLNQL